MNTVAANILINAQAAQAVATLSKVQAQLRMLSIAGARASASSNGPWYTGLAAGGAKINGVQTRLKALQAQTATANAASNRPWFASMTAAGSRMQWIGRQLTSNFTIPIVAATAAGVKWGLDFEKAMTRVTKVYGDRKLADEEVRTGMDITGKETKALGDTFIALSDKYAVASDQVANIAADWAAAGSSGLALAKQTKLTLDTMVLGEMDAEEATKSLVAIQAQWGQNTDELTNTLRQLNAVENETGTSLKDLVVGFSRASASARTAGLTTGELSAMIAALVPAAGSASEAGNALKTIFARILKPTNEFSQVLDIMNINTADTAWQSMNAGKRLEFLAQKFKGLTAPQRAVMSSLAAGNWQVNRFTQLMTDMGNSTGYYQKTLRLLADKAFVASIAEKELNQVLESNPQRAKQAGIIIQNSLMKAMEPLIPVIIQLSLWFGKLFRAFSEINPQIRSTIVVVLLLLGALGPLVVMAGLVKLSIGQLAPIFMFLGRMILLPLAPLKLLQLSFLRTLVTSRVVTTASLAMLSAFRVMAIGMVFVGGITTLAWKGLLVAARAIAPAIVAAWRSAWTAVAVFQAVTGVMLTTRQALVFATLFTIQNLWRKLSIASMVAWSAATTMIVGVWSVLVNAAFGAWAAASTLIISAWKSAQIMAVALWSAGTQAIMGLWRAITLAILVSWSAGWTALMASWSAAAKTIQAAWASASTLMTIGWRVAQIAIIQGGYALMLLAQKAWAAASILLSATMWKNVWAITSSGTKGMIAIVSKAGRMLVAVFASPFALVIAAVVGLIVIFRKQIAQAFQNIVNYFRNLPAGVAKGLSPIGSMFAKIKGVILRAFNALPDGVKNALLAVVRIVHAAAMKIYELFSYINPFARHSPSLVENVTNGMAAVNKQFINSAAVAENSINRMHSAVNSLKGLSKGLEVKNQQDADQKLASDAGKAGVGNAVPAYFAVSKEVAAGKAQMEALNKEIERNQQVVDRASAAVDAQQKKLDTISRATERYDKVLQNLNNELNTTKAIQDLVGQSLDSAKAKFDRYSNAQIKGTQAADDAIFANTMAQKRLQLQIAKMEEESGTVDSVTDSYSKLQGEIENLTAKQTELRKSGAGSDILGTYDKMIGDLKKQQSGLLNGDSDSPAGKIAALKTQLEKLQSQANIMDLEKSLKFDSLNRNLDKLKSNIEEMPYGDIASGLDSSRISVDAMQRSYDQLNNVMDGQNARIKAVENSKAQLQAVYDLENDKLTALKDNYDVQNEKLDKIKDAYSKIEESVRSGEEAMQNFSSAVDTAIQKQEELANAAEKAGKTKKGKSGSGGGGGEESMSPGAKAFKEGAEGDFATFGGTATIGREGGPGDQSADIENYTKQITDDLETSLGGLNPFKPLMDAWDKTKDWFSKNLGTFGNLFKGIGSAIGSAFSGEENGKVTKFGEIITKSKDALSGMWDTVKKGWDLVAGLFGPDLMTTVREFGKGFVGIWEKISGPLQNLGKTILPFIKTALVQLAPAFAVVLGVLETLWEVINGAIGPVFSWLGDLIGSIINIITGVLKILMGAFKVIQGVVQVLFGILKGLFTMDWSMFLDGLKKIGSGFADMFSGLWDIVKGIFTAIWSTIKNFVKLIWNTIWGFVKGIIDFFVHLWDVLVGNSIIPDMVKAIIDWFLKLPGTLFNLVSNLVVGIINFFLGLPGKVLAVLGDLGSTLWGWITTAWNWLVANGPSMLVGFFQWIAGLPGQILSALGDLGSTLWGWVKGAWDWVTNQGPQFIIGFSQWIAGVPGQVLGWLGDLGGKIGGWISGAFNWVVDNAGSLLSKFWGFILDFPARMVRGFGNIADTIGGWFSGVWNWLVDNAPGLLVRFSQWLTGLPGWIVGKLGNAASMLWNYGKDMIQGLLNGAESLLKKIGDWFLDKLPGWIKTPFKKALGIASPSKVFQGYGENIGQGLINGIDGMQKQVEDSSVAIAAAADKGEVGGMKISAVADTSSVGGTVSQLSKKVASTPISAPVKADAGGVNDPMADIDLDAAMAEINAFVTEANAKLATFSTSVSVAFGQVNTAASAAFANMNTLAVSTFTQMQTSVVTIITAMVTTVNGQLTLLLQYVTTFGNDFNTAWNTAWELISGTTTTGVDHTLTEWQRMADTMRTTLDNSIKPVFDDMKEMLKELEDSYTTTVDNIGTTWADIETKTKKPAGIVVNDVYNKGLRGAWNKFNDFLGVKALPEFTVPYKTGGPVWGPGNGTSDSVSAKLSRGEHVITAKEVQGAGGHAAVMAQRKMWSSGKSSSMDASLPYVEKFANGGPVGGNLPVDSPNGSSITTPIQQAMWNAAKTAFPNVQLFSGTRTEQVLGHPDYHNMGMALDLSPMPELARWIYAMNAKTPVLELIHWPLQGWQNLKNGAPLDYGAGTNADHENHVHWAMNVMVGNDGKIISMAAGGSGGGAPIDYSKIIEDSFKQDMDAIRSGLPKIPGGIGEWPKIAADVAQKKAVDYLKPLAKKMSISSGSAASPWTGAPNASVVEKVKAAMKPYGWDAGPEWEALNQLIGHESSWDPHAKNPGSTAYGLFQFLDSTWATVGGSITDDPYQQAVYGARYIKNKYQTPSGAWAFWQNPQPNPYGGNWYDSGGMLEPGSQVVHNQTGGPEPVLTTSQWNAMYGLAGNANVLTPEDVQDAVENANIATGNTGDAQTDAIIKGMDSWSKSWTPAIVSSTDAATEASNKVADAADTQSASTVLLSKSLGKYDTQISALTKFLTALSNSMQQSIKITVTVNTTNSGSTSATATTTTGNGNSISLGKVNGNDVSVAVPQFADFAPAITAFADLLDTIPSATRNWAADNPVAGETEQQRKARIAQNNLTNYAKGSFNVIKEVGVPLLKHTAIIGTAAEKLIQEDGPAWSSALAAIAANNPAGYAVAVLLVLKEVATILPLILNAILDIVPALIRAIVRFLTQFMPDSVYAYADMAAAEAAVSEQQSGGSTAMGQGQRYPTEAMSNSSGNENINLYMYGDLVMPNVSDGSDANDFVDQLKLLASS